MSNNNMLQIITCKCGAVVAACVEPECYTDEDWHKSVRDYTKKGYTVSTVMCGNVFGDKRCTCKQ